MALTESTMLKLGTMAPDFTLTDVVTGKTVRRDDYRGQKALLVMFICAHCPYVKHVENGLATLGKDYDGKPVGIVAISSNDADTYPDDSPAGLKKQAKTQGFRFPYLFDETQGVARAYKAACTPDIYLFDADFKLVYRGQFDGSRPGNGVPVTGEDLRDAIDAVLGGQEAELRSARFDWMQYQVEGKTSGVSTLGELPAQRKVALLTPQTPFVSASQFQPLQIVAKFWPEVRSLEGEFDCGLQHSEFVAGIESPALKRIAKYLLLFEKCLDTVSELDLSASAWRRLLKKLKDSRGQHVTADDCLL